MTKSNTIEGFEAIIDIVSEEYFKECHIKGAINICAYEMAFIKKIEETFPNKEAKILVYGPSDAEGKYAYDKLEKAGYVNAAYLDGGIDKYQEEGGLVEISRDFHEAKIQNGDYKLNREDSVVRWIGRNRGNSHHGTIDCSEGLVTIENERMSRGSFDLDFHSIKCIDLAGDPSYGYLIEHLKSADFFLASKFPTAEVEIVLVEKISNRTRSESNYDVTANLSMRGKTNKINFEAAIHPRENQITIQAHLDIDRTDWGMVYGSERFLRHLGMHILQDEITIELQLVLDKI